MYNINIFKLAIKVYHVLQSPLSIISYAKKRDLKSFAIDEKISFLFHIEK